jgi:hypothetical protein
MQPYSARRCLARSLARAARATQRAASQARLRSSRDLQNLDLEEQATVRRDAPGREATGTVALGGRDVELAAAADLHPQAALVPAFDHLVNTGLVSERLLAVVLRGPELLAGLLHDPRRVHSDRVRLRDLLAGALGQNLVRRLHALDLVWQVDGAGREDQREEACDAGGEHLCAATTAGDVCTAGQSGKQWLRRQTEREARRRPYGGARLEEGSSDACSTFGGPATVFAPAPAVECCSPMEHWTCAPLPEARSRNHAGAPQGENGARSTSCRQRCRQGIVK